MFISHADDLNIHANAQLAALLAAAPRSRRAASAAGHKIVCFELEIDACPVAASYSHPVVTPATDLISMSTAEFLGPV